MWVMVGLNYSKLYLCTLLQYSPVIVSNYIDLSLKLSNPLIMFCLIVLWTIMEPYIILN